MYLHCTDFADISLLASVEIALIYIHWHSEGIFVKAKFWYVFFMYILNDVERARDEHLYHSAWRKKKVQKWAIDSKEHNRLYILEAGKNVTNFTRKTDNFPVSA